MIAHAFMLCAAVFVGGFFGGITRWALTKLPRPLIGTWVANMIGCAVFGFSSTMSGLWPVLLGAGFAGACSTLSTLAKELGRLAVAGKYTPLVFYAFATASLGILAAWIGAKLGGGPVYPVFDTLHAAGV